MYFVYKILQCLLVIMFNSLNLKFPLLEAEALFFPLESLRTLTSFQIPSDVAGRSSLYKQQNESIRLCQPAVTQ
jgi:hypothetical protein